MKPNFIVTSTVALIYASIAASIAHYFCPINLRVTYDWMGGLWQGLNAPGHWVLSFIIDAPMQAFHFTPGYFYAFWGGVSVAVLIPAVILFYIYRYF